MRQIALLLIVVAAALVVTGCGQGEVEPAEGAEEVCRGTECAPFGLSDSPVIPGAACTPFCDGRECGDDSCGGTCGQCPAGTSCNLAGQCMAPDCDGRECGPDGAGGSCGACGGGEVCGEDGRCGPCVPTCGGRECGADGCGGVCGSCSSNEYCSDEGTCERTSGKTYTRTRYPIVLAHGMLGFSSLFGLVDYYFGIPGALRDGGATVFVTSVAQVNDSVTRGEQLLAQVEEILAATGASKVNIIGHSQGGLDARYVAGVRPDLVASVTTVATPHKGSDVATFLATHLSPDGVITGVLAAYVNILGTVIDLISGGTGPQDARATLHMLSAAGCGEFAERFPMGVPETECGEGPRFVGEMGLWSFSGASPYTNPFDVSDPWMWITSRFFSAKNDGLVGACSSHFGRVLRDDYRMNHLDEVNHLLGVTSFFETSPVQVFRNHANRLRNAGY